MDGKYYRPPIRKVCRAPYVGRRVSFVGMSDLGGWFEVKRNRFDRWLRILLAQRSREANVRYPTEASRSAVYTPPSNAIKQSPCLAYHDG